METLYDSRRCVIKSRHMDDILNKLVIAFVPAAVGFFWFLAYKHPRSFKAIAAPFAFIFVLALVVTLI